MADLWSEYAAKLGARIRDLRRAKGISQAKTCQAVGMSVDTWSRLERGDGQEPRLSTLMRVADALDVNLGDLFPRRDESLAGTAEHEVMAVVRHLPFETQDALLKILRQK